jgi:AraC family transcriptional regulator
MERIAPINQLALTQRNEMTQSSAYGSGHAKRFGLREATSFVTRTLSPTVLAVTHIRCDVENNGLTAPIPKEDALLVTLQLRECPRHDLWLDGKAMRTGHLKAGMINVYDLRSNPVVNSVSSFENLHFYLPRKVLNGFSERERGVMLADAVPNPGIGIHDTAIRELGYALLPAFERPEEANRLFVDHVITAIAAAVANKFLGRERPSHTDLKLAPWQMRLVTEMLDEKLSGSISVSDLAKASDLSIDVFRRAFFNSFGMFPHQWLMKRRLGRVSLLLRRTELPLPDIATSCGFASTQHLVRAINGVAGKTLAYSMDA